MRTRSPRRTWSTSHPRSFFLCQDSPTLQSLVPKLQAALEEDEAEAGEEVGEEALVEEAEVAEEALVEEAEAGEEVEVEVAAEALAEEAAAEEEAEAAAEEDSRHSRHFIVPFEVLDSLRDDYSLHFAIHKRFCHKRDRHCSLSSDLDLKRLVVWTNELIVS